MSLHFGTLHFTTPPWCTKSPAAEADEGELEKGFEDAGGGTVAQGEGEGAEGRGVHAVGEAAAHAHVVPAGDVAFQAFGVWTLLMEKVELAADLVGLFGRTRVTITAVVEGGGARAVGYAVAAGEARPSEQVLAGLDAFGEAADSFQGVAAHHYRRGPQRRLGLGGDFKIIVDDTAVTGKGQTFNHGGHNFSIGHDVVVGGSEDCTLRIITGKLFKRLNMVGAPLVVGVDKGHKLALGFGNAAVAGGADTTVLLRDKAKFLNSKLFDSP